MSLSEALCPLLKDPRPHHPHFRGALASGHSAWQRRSGCGELSLLVNDAQGPCNFDFPFDLN